MESIIELQVYTLCCSAQLSWRLEWLLVGVAAGSSCGTWTTWLLTGVARRLIGPLICGGAPCIRNGELWGIAFAWRRLLFLGRRVCRAVVDGLFVLKRGDLRSQLGGGTEGRNINSRRGEKSRRRGGTVRAFR